ncbi:MAG: ABC transporter permease [Proteobacteria bacterium]|nr:ABC transporter permease [Pseudomonadota bacterium]
MNWIGLWTMVRREIQRLARVPIQAVVAPLISALLFIFIFGFVVGGRIRNFGQFNYLEFVLPGVVMMNVISAAFLQATSQIYFQRFQKSIEEILVAPLSYVEMIAGTVSIVVLRSVFTAVGIMVIGWLFGAVHMKSLPEFLFWVVFVSMIFGFLGIIVALWAKTFEQLNILMVFFIQPLAMVGGVFNTVAMLPPWLRFLAYGNPLFYFINGLRHSMIGFTEVNEWLGAMLTVGLTAVLGGIVWRLYAIGWGLRE